MSKTVCAAGLLLVSIAVASCTVEELSGCASDDDCRFGRTCVDNVCVFPGSGAGALDTDGGRDGGSPIPDAGRDPGRTDGPASQARIEVAPTRLDLGRAAPGEAIRGSVTATSLGPDPLRLDAPFLQNGLFEAVLAGSDVLSTGQMSVIEVIGVAEFPPDGQGVLRDTLVIPSNAANQPRVEVPVSLSIEVGPPPECLDLRLPNELVLEVGEVRVLSADLINCGGSAVSLDSARVSVDGPSVSATLLDPGLPDQLQPGEPWPVLVEVTGLTPGRSSVEVTVISQGGARTSSVVAIQVRGPCELGLLATADRDGPSGSGTLSLILGHQILLSGTGGRAVRLIEPTLATAPDDSLRLLVQTSPTETVLVPDVPGTYTVTASLEGRFDCSGEGQVTVDVALPEADFVAWAVWPEPIAETGTVNDLDFYVARLTDDGYLWQEPGFHAGPTSQTANFGAPDSAQDDPTLNADYNTQGFGPELITIPSPSASEQIAIGVHAFDTASDAPAQPRIQIVLDGVEVFDATQDLTQNQFWLAAETLGLELVGGYDVVTQGFPEPELP